MHVKVEVFTVSHASMCTYVSRFSTSCMPFGLPNKTIFRGRPIFLFQQRMASKEVFYVLDKVRTDIITVQGNKKDSNYPHTNYVSVWFAKLRAFLKIKIKDLKRAAHTISCDKEGNAKNSDIELLFVPHYQVFPKEEVSHRSN